ncbi:DUF5313 domain-containing protein [Rhodococcus sp. ARC_M8]|uniref:DUF5313 family protein n=1 Tax=Rhodococcus TaxID=1827 RepID=UPI000691261D|nr:MULTISPECIES: DUF5313 family protein [Mycobacteriales]MCJ0950424.1 DUF5313 domain-containing protein [Rhodococcus sp. ARC_M8]MYV31228.1 hypothetical protein [Rhodococcus erythropolis]
MNRNRTRPLPWQWVGYAFGRTLPSTMTDWVANDLTGNHAVVRHLIRGQVPFLPIYAVFMFFPGELWLRGSMVLLAVLLSLFFTASYMEENRQRRLVRHMLPRDLTNSRKAQESELVKKRYLAAHPESEASRTAAAPIAPGREH